MTVTNDVEKRFADALDDLVTHEDRATLAALRRGLGKDPGSVPEMHPFVLRRLPEGMGLRRENDFYLVASLFSIHRKGWAGGDPRRPTNLGASLALLRQRDGSASIERRFVAMLNAQREDLPHHLRNIISLLSSHEVHVDFAQLLRDLRWWDAENRSVQRHWARSFWDTGFRPNDGAASVDASAEN
jgi:CRISPR system Cascade subunit CasB